MASTDDYIEAYAEGELSGSAASFPAGKAEGFSARTALILGEEGLEKLAASRVCVFGLGGVGAAAAVDLVRVGVGHILACDFDEVGESNLNRLAFGFRRFLGVPKAHAFAEIARDINPDVVVDARPLFVTGGGAADAVPEDCGFYLDCIDSLNSKANLIAVLARSRKPFASSMGMGGRLDPERVRMGSLWEANGCPLARSVRQRLRRFGLSETDEVPCAWSDEPPAEPGPPAPPHPGLRGRDRRRQGSSPFVPQTAGHILASYTVRRLLSLI
jgi:tRNA A37 threonylcarbamoyladenosine dehydratase